MYHLRVFNIMGKTFFFYSFYHFYKENFSFYCYFNSKSIKFCQEPLGLDPAGPYNNQALAVCLIIKWATINVGKGQLAMKKDILVLP